MIVNASTLPALKDGQLRRQAIVAFANLGDYICVAEDGTLGASTLNLAHERLVALERFDIDDRPLPATKGGGCIRRLRIRMACKVTALNALAKHLGLFGAPPPPGYTTSEPEIIAAGDRWSMPNFTVSAERLRDEIIRIAFATMDSFIESDGPGSWRLVLPHAEPGELATLRELVVAQHIHRPDGAAPVIRSVNLKLADKLRALEALTRLPSWLHGSGLPAQPAADRAARLAATPA